MKILIVEDDEETAGFIAAGLVARGHEATIARDGREGYLRATAIASTCSSWTACCRSSTASASSR